jgi:hypothetical protein
VAEFMVMEVVAVGSGAKEGNRTRNFIVYDVNEQVQIGSQGSDPNRLYSLMKIKQSTKKIIQVSPD